MVVMLLSLKLMTARLPARPYMDLCVNELMELELRSIVCSAAFRRKAKSGMREMAQSEA